MRVIAISTLKLFWEQYPEAEGSLRAWYQEATNAIWKNHGQLKIQFSNASVLNAKRVVFNIKGNAYRLVVDIEYRMQIIFIVWAGTHTQYEKLDIKKIGYDKTNKK